MKKSLITSFLKLIGGILFTEISKYFIKDQLKMELTNYSLDKIIVMFEILAIAIITLFFLRNLYRIVVKNFVVLKKEFFDSLIQAFEAQKEYNETCINGVGYLTEVYFKKLQNNINNDEKLLNDGLYHSLNIEESFKITPERRKKMIAFDNALQNLKKLSKQPVNDLIEEANVKNRSKIPS